MKVGMLTIYKAKNYGTQLQAWALYNILRDFDSVSEVKVMSIEDEPKPCLMKPRTKNPLVVAKRLRHYFSRKQFVRKFETGKLEAHYDLIIIGSDELWNVSNIDLEISPYYVGDGFDAPRKITYAMSCNTTTVDEFVKEYGKNPLECLDAISVRDCMTYKLVKSLGVTVQKRVLDPTFLWNFDYVLPKERHYLLVYSYGMNESQQKIVLDFAKKNKLKTIAVGFELWWCDKYVLCSAEEFIGYIKNAAYVVTSTFHGTVFSIKYGAKFASFVGTNSKIKDLLEHFGLEERNATTKTLDKIFQLEIDYRFIWEQIDYEKQESLEWLQEQIKE